MSAAGRAEQRRRVTQNQSAGLPPGSAGKRWSLGGDRGTPCSRSLSLDHRSFPARLAALALLLASSLLGCIQIELFGGGRGNFVETVVHVQGEQGPGAARFLLVEVDGIIHLGDQSSFLGTRESTVARIREQLDVARRDASLRGVLLRIDSPGGGATASDVIYAELLRFKRDRAIPVVAHFLGMAASGGYYVAMAADELVAEPTTVTGSIGVIFAGVNVSGLMKRWGIEDQTLTAGRYKDAGSMLRPQTPEDREILQSVVDDLYERFRAVVERGRPNLDREQVDRLADGRLYSAQQALENGLVDRVGDIEEAVDRLQERAGVSGSVVVSYHRSREWRRNLYTRSRDGETGLEQRETPPLLLEGLAPGFLYLWPGASHFPWLSVPSIT